MANGIGTGDPRGFNKGHSSKFRVDSQVRQTPEEGTKQVFKVSFWNFGQRPLLNPQWSLVLIPLAITGYKC